MNYYIKFENNFYNVIDVNTGQMIASFISDIEANEFVQSLFDMSNDSYGLGKTNPFNPYNNINYQSLTPKMGPPLGPLQNQFDFGQQPQPWIANPPLQNQPQTPSSQNGGQTTVFNNYWQAPSPQNSFVQTSPSLPNPLNQNQYFDQQNTNQIRVPNNGNQMYQNQNSYPLENQYDMNLNNPNLTNNLNLQKNKINENVSLDNNRNFLNSGQTNFNPPESHSGGDFTRNSFDNTNNLSSNSGQGQNQRLNENLSNSKNLYQESFNGQNLSVNGNQKQKMYEQNNSNQINSVEPDLHLTNSSNENLSNNLAHNQMLNENQKMYEQNNSNQINSVESDLHLNNSSNESLSNNLDSNLAHNQMLNENQKGYEQNNSNQNNFVQPNSQLHKDLNKDSYNENHSLNSDNKINSSEFQNKDQIINNQNNRLFEESRNSEIEIVEKNIFEEVENDFKFDFNDNTLSVDSSLFEEDKMGAIIYVSKNFINNTDDDSLGEVAAYQDIKHIPRNERQTEEVKEQKIHYSEPLVSDLEYDDFEDSIEEIENKEKTISEIYENDLVSDTYLSPKRDVDVIDLGPINEYDEVYSTPRKDTENDDLENIILSKKEKNILKKARKLEKRSRKKEK
ncbi:hypothetical protein [Spiroplasma floricola]|uniref:Uncharacterized protein n=1 Tax=Spiroplasma floricola 23-6 TaxID=1336749 RepID=A0A2K8SE44_9MOLU|nr:hypothetical protein [Spiroplasma floricola]AUB31090.1 hypothetical protein SFLOR_v1c00270 [Spiroplasma floricola 23-6]